MSSWPSKNEEEGVLLIMKNVVSIRCCSVQLGAEAAVI